MSRDMEFISAGAGSGKTYALTQKLNALLCSEEIRPKAVIATTFTRMAAKELKDRVREALIEEGRLDLSEQTELALIGTVNSICGRLLERFAFEAGIPPGQDTLDETHADNLFRKALDKVIRQDLGLVAKMNGAAQRLSVEDWEKDVKAIVDRARANNMAAEVIMSFSADSIKSLLAYFPKANTAFDATKSLSIVRRAIAGISSNIELNIDATVKTKTYVTGLKTSLRLLEQGQLPWVGWAGLSKKSPGVKSEEFGNLVKGEVCDYGSHPQLHDDIQFFITKLFDYAAQSLTAFQDLKARQGLVDFVDQEQRLYGILDQDEVKASLGADLDLLLVDEFQDTSPIQLAVFMKLASLAKKVVFVGDIKQSIYGFRGADPSLMEAIVHNLKDLGITEEVLDQSWRSRPALVSFVNDIFSQTFADRLRQDQICLRPARDELEDETAIESWELAGRKIEIQLKGLVSATDKMIDSGQRIFDKTSKAIRPAHYGDVAVLCKTNARLKALAETFAQAGIPTKLMRPGLMGTPEATLAIACLRRLVDPSDSLASAEIHTLSNCESPEIWLVERLAFVQAGEQHFRDWKVDQDGPINALHHAADRLPFLTPAETLRLAMGAANVYETVRRWGPTHNHAAQREKNLNTLIELGDDYIAECELQSQPATVAGLISYFDQLADKKTDYQAAGGTDKAVNLLTHHGAKGLEWPVVILLDLDAQLKSRIWGLNVPPKNGRIDINTILEGRTLRYWPPIFGANKNGIHILDLINAGEEVAQADEREYLEQQRLLYVSMTRARDRLIFAFPKKNIPNFPWAETLNVGIFWPTETGNDQFDPNKYKAAFKAVEPPVDLTPNPMPFTPKIVDQAFNAPKIARRKSPSSFEPIAAARVTDTITLGERLPITDGYDVNAMGDALHAVIASKIMGHNATLDILKIHGVETAISAKDANASAERLIETIMERWSPISVFCEYPILYQNLQGQTVSGWIDLLIETKDGYVIIDHKASPRQRAAWEEIALNYSGQLNAYKLAFSTQENSKKTETWIHFALTGGLVKLDFDE